MGQICSCAEQLLQNPVCPQGTSLIVASESKQSVQESSVTLSFRSSSRKRCLGRTIYKKMR